MAVRVVQVGIGNWGLGWGKLVRRTADVELVACVDISPAMPALAQSELDMPPERCFTTLAAALGAVEADAVLITAALAAHIPVALEALDAGKHVLLEKPFAPTLADAQRAVEVAARQGRILMVSQNYRFFPAARTVAALVREGTLGEVGTVSIDFRRNDNRAPREGYRHYTFPQPMVMDMAIHHFDLLRMILGREPHQVSCTAWNPSWSNFEEPAAALATITFAGGTMVSYRGSWVSPAPQTSWTGVWRMECAGGEILWSGRNSHGATGDRVAVRPLGKPIRRVELPTLPHLDREGSLAAFVQAVRSGQEPETSGRANLGSIALMYAALESANAGLPVFVPHPTN